jgi:molybdopterin/thiamine biosynthesis adenylyltransferase
MNFSDEEIQRYSRQLILPEIGGKGQKKIRNARLFLIGAGGLGSPAALYLVAGGLGKLGLIDSDVVDLSNLQRQVLHTTKSVNQPKVESAKARLNAINPDCTIETYQKKLDASNIMDLMSGYDFILDGSDNFPTRFLVNDACFFLKKPLISASIFRFEGQLTTIKAYAADYPCYRCLFPEPPPADLVTSCQEAGVLGALAGTMGVLQATEAFKEILGVGSSLTNRLLLYDALDMRFREVKTRKDPTCPLCGPHPKVTTLMEYEASCRL